MKRLLVAARDDPGAWAAHLRAELPDHELLLEAPTDGRPVSYIAVGWPPAGLIASLNGLELVLSLNAGIEPLLVPGVVPEGTPIVRMVDPGLTEGMVEWVLAQVLAWHRNLFPYADRQAAGQWAPMSEKLARERIVTVLGAGVLGAAAARALASVGFQTRVWSRTGRQVGGAATFAGEDGFLPALAGAEVVVSLLPSTPETAERLDSSAFAQLAPGGFVVNGGRGRQVVDLDLIAALDSGHLAGAALDVFRQEPLPADHPFWSHPGVRISPHVAAPTHARTAAAVLAASIRAWERGEPLANLVDRARGY